MFHDQQHETPTEFTDFIDEERILRFRARRTFTTILTTIDNAVIIYLSNSWSNQILHANN